MSEMLEEIVVDPALSGDHFLKFADEAEMLSVLFHDVAVEFDTTVKVDWSHPDLHQMMWTNKAKRECSALRTQGSLACE